MRLGTKCILSISLTLAFILGISFTWIIQRQRYLLKEEIKKQEEYKIGDLRGAISVIAPLEPIYASLRTNIIILITYVLIRRLITSPISKISHTMSAIASGDLDKRIHMNSRDEIGMLATSINKMIEDLQKTTVSKAYVDNIIESMIDTLIVIDKNNKIKTVNKSTLKLL